MNEEERDGVEKRRVGGDGMGKRKVGRNKGHKG